MQQKDNMSAFHFVPKIGDSPGAEVAAGSESEPTEDPQASRHAEQAKRYRANPDYLLREIAGEAILIPVGESAAKLNGMLSLNETFRFLWEQFQTPHTVHDVVLAATEHFDGSTDQIENDIRDYVRESVQHGILIEEEQVL